ncbi:MAG: DUF4918 family protein [Lewinellaceae bacterium]|nr:DUF4918 family protein [Lewinellaceae bacterium]
MMLNSYYLPIQKPMSLAQRILGLNRSLRPDWELPAHVELLYPYSEASTWSAMEQFYHKYYGDELERVGIFGINPGRFGAGITGVPFTDPIRLEAECGITNDFAKKPELSSEFVYRVVNEWGGPGAFYGQFYIASLSPLGFTKDGKNYNYYDDKKLLRAVEPYIIHNIRAQIELGLSTRVALCMGQGQNMQYFEKLNQQHAFFESILPLPHPRWVMQYRRKRLGEFVTGYVDSLRLARKIILTAAFLITMALSVLAQADYVFWDGPIYTLEAPGAKVEALAVKGERIIFAGPWEEAQQLIGDSTRVVGLHGRTMLPGFTDAHVHPISGGLALMGCNLADIEQPDSMLAVLKNYAAAHPEKPWIQAYNFWLAAFPDGNPKKELLDSIIPGRPVYIVSSDAHSAWVNSRALELAGITASAPNPLNGLIERDERSGEPSGTLREEAMGLVEKLIPPHTPEELAEALRKGLEVANSVGVTNFIEASAREEYIETYLELARRQELTAHVSVSIYGDISKGQECVRQVLGLNEKYADQAPHPPGQMPDLAFGQVKLFMDGVVEGKTAAMLDNYHGDNHRGFPNASPDMAAAVITAFDKAGMQIHVHAIGDRGIRMTLDAFEQARKQNGLRDSRHHIAHLHVIHPDDIPRFRELDVIANFQALWATLEDTYMTDLNYPYLGAERVEWQYPIGTVARSGGRLAFGSDWDVSTMDPFDAMQVAVTRRGPDSVVREPWTPQHLVDVQMVVEGYTKGGAYLTFRENECGTLTVGKLADLIILGRDVFQCPKFELYQTQVLMTMFRGRVVYGGY